MDVNEEGFLTNSYGFFPKTVLIFTASELSLISDLCSACTIILSLFNLKLGQCGILDFNFYVVLLSYSNHRHGKCGTSLCLISDWWSLCNLQYGAVVNMSDLRSV